MCFILSRTSVAAGLCLRGISVVLGGDPFYVDHTDNNLLKNLFCCKIRYSLHICMRFFMVYSLSL
jgi:hypothetical protein